MRTLGSINETGEQGVAKADITYSDQSHEQKMANKEMRAILEQRVGRVGANVIDSFKRMKVKSLGEFRKYAPSLIAELGAEGVTNDQFTASLQAIKAELRLKAQADPSLKSWMAEALSVFDQAIIESRKSQESRD